MNLADLVLALIIFAALAGGFRLGLAGLVLAAVATALSLVAAALAAFWIASEVDLPRIALAVLAPAAFLAALGLAGGLLRLAARQLTRFIHRLPFSTVDRLLGAGIAGIAAVALSSLVLLAALYLPGGHRFGREVRSARLAPVVLGTGARSAALLAEPFPGLTGLAARLAAAAEEVGGRAGGGRRSIPEV